MNFEEQKRDMLLELDHPISGLLFDDRFAKEHKDLILKYVEEKLYKFFNTPEIKYN
jgi:hypothetical protein